MRVPSHPADAMTDEALLRALLEYAAAVSDELTSIGDRLRLLTGIVTGGLLVTWLLLFAAAVVLPMVV